ncbi:MAG: hypothetical protein ACYTG4_03575 [Planctomycetota bacterium]|jgi:tetratricopeptide (TPR) repeat protein
MMRLHHLSTALLVTALAAGFCGSALAKDQVVLRFKDGKHVPGRVEKITDEGVHHLSDRGSVFWSWDRLTPYSQFEVRASVLDEEDGDARLGLGVWALEHALPSEARREIEKARGLGAGEAKELDALLERCDRLQAEQAFARADLKESDGDLKGAVAVLRSYLMHAPASTWTQKAREKASDLVRRLETDETRKRLEKDRLKRDAKKARRAAYVLEQLEDAEDLRGRAARVMLVGLREEPRGSFSRYRRALAEAEAVFIKSIEAFDRCRRIAGNDHPAEAREALAARRSVKARIFDLNLRLSRRLVGYKQWKEAQKALSKALRIDPVHKEALDLQEKINKNWVRRSASGLTNAKGRSSSGTGGK